MCERWKRFELFWEDMGSNWYLGASIERIDNDKGYCPENCRWATVVEQNKNRRNTIHVQYEGRTQCLLDWCRELGLVYSTVYRWVKSGMDPLEAITVSVQKKLTK